MYTHIHAYTEREYREMMFSMPVAYFIVHSQWHAGYLNPNQLPTNATPSCPSKPASIMRQLGYL
jgi:hypothetical protein